MASPTPPPGVINYELNRNRLAVPSLILTNAAGVATGIELQNNGGVLDIPGGLSIAGTPVRTAAGINPAGTLALPGDPVGTASTGLTQGLATNSLSLVANAIEALRALTIASGVDYLTVTPGIAGNPGVVTLGAAGSDTNVSINLVLKGTGVLQVGGVQVFPGTPTPGVVQASSAIIAGAQGQLAGLGLTVPAALTTAGALTAAQSNSFIVLNSATSFVITLPAANALGAGASISYVFALQVATGSGVGHIIRPAGSDVMRANFITTPAAAKGAMNTQATSKIGDMLTVWSDGVSAWYAAPDGGTWTREA